MPGEAEPDVEQLVELLSLKTFIEACLVLEEGVATHRDIDFGMMAGAGLDPRRGLMPPFMKADSEGLDKVLGADGERRASATASASPRRRSCAASSPRAGWGSRAARASTPTPAPTPINRPRSSSWRHSPATPPAPVSAAMRTGRRRDRVAGERADELDLPAGRRGPRERVGARQGHRRACARDRLLQPVPVQRRRGHQGVHDDGRDGGRELLERTHALLREIGTSGVATIAAVNGLAFGGGCELAMACDIRIAARSALFGQPEIKLGIIPGFGGTQRLPRLVGENKALEMNLVGDPILAEEAFELGLVNRVVEDHELLDTALAWARRLAAQAPLAIEQIKRVSGAGDLDAGIAAEQQGFASVLASSDAREGISAFLAKRAPRFEGRSDGSGGSEGTVERCQVWWSGSGDGSDGGGHRTGALRVAVGA